MAEESSIEDMAKNFYSQIKERDNNIQTTQSNG